MRIGDTFTEMARLVTQRHVNPLSTLYGGYMLMWLVDAGTITALKLAGRGTVLGYMDRVHFVEPVRLGDLLLYRAWCVNVRRTSLTVLVEAYVRRDKWLALATVGRLIFVAVDSSGKPVPIGMELEAQEGWERDIHDHFRRWRSYVGPALESEPAERGWPLISSRLVMPEDALHGDLMYGGRLLYYLDELAFVKAWEKRRGAYVTVSVNSIAFKRPIFVGDVIYIHGEVTGIGNTSIEVGVEVAAEGIHGRRRVAEGYFTFVHMADGKPAPIGVEGPKPRSAEHVSEARKLRGITIPDHERIPATWILIQRYSGASSGAGE